MFNKALGLFSPFAAANASAQAGAGAAGAAKPQDAPEPAGPDIDALKKQLAEMQAQIESLSRK
jgi:polyhydroxyalkanoate synthesis regulator protein